MTKSKYKDKFSIGIGFVALSIAVSLLGFATESRDLAGLAAFKEADKIESASGNDAVAEFDDISSLGSLAAGNYYIDKNGLVYYIDDDTMFPAAKIKNVDGLHQNIRIYIDANGDIGYILNQILLEEYEK